MQNQRRTYRERLTPSLWILVASAVIAPMAALSFLPVNATLGLAIGVVAVLLILAGLMGLSTRIEVGDGMLRAGRGRIEVGYLGEAVALTGEEARRARGPELDARAWHIIRGGIDGVVAVPVTDPDDPVTQWIISSRTPDRLAAAIEVERRYAAQSRQMKP